MGDKTHPLPARPSSFPTFGGCLVINFSLSPEGVGFERQNETNTQWVGPLYLHVAPPVNCYCKNLPIPTPWQEEDHVVRVHPGIMRPAAAVTTQEDIILA